ncbi:MAG: xylulokinase [Maritimibacter sp.]
MSFLGIDIGTSGLRLLLVDPTGAPIGAVERSYDTQHPHFGWSEQDPQTWINALESGVASLRSAHPEFADLEGIGAAGHMHGAVLLDKNDDVLRPCILWNDSRSHVEAAKLDADPAFRALSGNIVFPGFTAPKLDWVRTHEPAVFDSLAKVLLPAAYLTLYLTGEHVADMSDSAGTAWFDTGARAWSEPLLSASNMRAYQMPRLVEGCEAAAQMRQSLAQTWGLHKAPVIAGGAGDNAAAACGLGVVEQGQGFVSLGTSGVLLMARNAYHPAPATALHTFCHALPDRWYQMGVMLSAADSLTWLSTLTGASPKALTDELGDTLKAPDRLMFLPYLSGERTPHNDADIRGSFHGISTATTRKDMTRAVLEGVCFGLRDAHEAMRETGGHVRELFAIGGGSASQYWLKTLATTLNMPLALPEGREFGAALGAARLGMIAATEAPITEVLRRPKAREIILPDAAQREAFDAAYERFRAAYPVAKTLP